MGMTVNPFSRLAGAAADTVSSVDGSGSAQKATPKLTPGEEISLLFAEIEGLVENERQASTDALVSQINSQQCALNTQEEGLAAQKFASIVEGVFQITQAALGVAGGVAGGAMGSGMDGARLGLDAGQAVGSGGSGIGTIVSGKKQAAAQQDQAEAGVIQSLSEVAAKSSDSSAQSAQTQIQSEQSMAAQIQQAEAQEGAAVARNIGS
ncbi:hypothetical protein [Burkholderia sp. Bp8986]|uniref:hypothetical protein n=1 Tax=Burkholderia sp. Bp8986 TaxID=2184550 RepID=UPI000F5A45C8|nr:hypothetical protein [Burkholderia sp. Bp8986]